MHTAADTQAVVHTAAAVASHTVVVVGKLAGHKEPLQLAVVHDRTACYLAPSVVAVAGHNPDTVDVEHRNSLELRAQLACCASAVAVD